VVRIDTLELLLEGTNFCRLDKDVARPGVLSYDAEKCALVFQTKKMGYFIPLAAVSHLLCGQTTLVFEKLKIPRTLGLVSFSIMYMDQKTKGLASWDLIAPSIDSFEIWV
jgi:hypothetical protein